MGVLYVLFVSLRKFPSIPRVLMDYMIFFFYLDLTDCVDWFLNIEPTLHTWTKSHLIVVYYLKKKVHCWVLFAKILLRTLTSKVNEKRRLVFLFFCAVVDIRVILASKLVVKWFCSVSGKDYVKIVLVYYFITWCFKQTKPRLSSDVVI